ncbi:MAG: ferritin-like domain-containing protein [Actinomycetota bacterium]|nr:ferritin-like domain-containing protein [Actinomycetota bacterium]
MDIEVTEIGEKAAPQRLGRRALLGAGVGGAALSLLPLLSGRAVAAPAEGENTTTTAPPTRPTSADVALLAFAQQLELTARDLYDKALAATGWSAAELTVVSTFRESHEAYAQSLSGLLGADAPGAASPELLRTLGSGWAGAPGKFLAAAYELESAAVATHADLIAQLQGTDALSLIASIQIAEARHGTVLADMAGMTELPDLLVETEANSLLVQG